MQADLVVVGAGLFGLTIAERAADDLGARVLVLDRRRAIGGNALTEFDPRTGIEVHRYGTHVFHTSNRRVWAYVNRFTEFTDYVHKVRTKHQGDTYPMPVNLTVINRFFGTDLTPAQAKEFVDEQAAPYRGRPARNLEEKGLSLVGPRLFDAFFRGYTSKQWQMSPDLLPPEVIARLPVRFTTQDRYFDDPYQGLPRDGYASWFARMVDNPRIEVRLGSDFLDPTGLVNRDNTSGQVPVVYTGPIDAYFDFAEGRLHWRTLDFETEILPVGDHQGGAVVNYADDDVPFTRVHEFRHLHPERRYPPDRTVIAREIARAAGPGDEPYYPVNTAEDRRMLTAYRRRRDEERGVLFGGRLGSYRYLDMHMAIASALTLYDNQLRDLLRGDRGRSRTGAWTTR
jgi:UDP-galactopyranose mutase